MTAHDIFRIGMTVAVAQLVCDLFFNYVLFSKEGYKRAVANLKRAQIKLQKMTTAESTGNKQQATSAKTLEKQAKKLQRAQDDVAEASSDVARRHMGPTFYTSLVFLLMHRILGTEYEGKVIAILPFVPFKLLRRLTQWGGLREQLADVQDWSSGEVTDVNQACGFLFVYIICSLSVKFVIHQVVGTPPPKGADKGVMSIMESPKNQRFLKAVGVDMDELKNQ